ncbi:MAG: type IX secretion system plug protein domain-containing protein [Bacteroidota bacterium]
MLRAFNLLSQDRGNLLSLLMLTLFISPVLASHTPPNQEWTCENRVYDEAIRTVQLYRDIYETSYPVIYLGQALPLTLEFDELMAQEDRASDFLVDIINCDVNWQPTNVLPIEFFDGFTQDRLTSFRRSRHTKVPYVHFLYTFPQQGERFKMSGNYLLKVYRDDAEETVVLTQRFIVVEQRTEIQLINQLAPMPERLELEEIAFTLTTEGLPIRNNFRDLKIFLLQNFRWGDAFQFDQPRFQSPNRLEYYTDLSQAFDTGNEFRFHDIRSVRFYSNSIREVLEREEVYDVILYRDQVRNKNSLGPIQDFNGAYFVQISDFQDGDVHADYVYNLFALQSPPLPDANVYINGSFTGWQLEDMYQMEYNDTQRQYELDLLLKQGFYDYQYVVKTPKKAQSSPIEGPHRFGENFYSLLVYFRSPMDRTDRLIGYQTINYID